MIRLGIYLRCRPAALKVRNVMVRTAHDPVLFKELKTLALSFAPDLREGRMFGCPAIYVGRKMACCVLGSEVGLRIPAAMADEARASGRARAFTPYGKRPMREWIALDLPPKGLRAAADLIKGAIEFARKNNDNAK
jgi:hypothetical protein